MSIHRAFLLAAVAFTCAPNVAYGADRPGAAAEDAAESGSTVPDSAGRGLRLGDTGLGLGGYVTGEVEDLEGDDHYSEVEGNLFVFYEPARFFRLFADIEFESGGAALERGYLELAYSDALKVRLGKFLTPIGRWNQAHIEPLTWTTAEPLVTEIVIDDTVSGASVEGALFPEGGALSYAMYGSVGEPIEPDEDEDFAEHSAGGRLEWASLDNWSAGLSYYASKPRADWRWHHLAGVDALWQPHPRVELSAEAVAGESSRARGAVRGAFVQAAVETRRSLYVVGRFESLAMPGVLRTVRIGTAGLAWAPRPWFRLKADYTFANQTLEDAEPGARLSVSFLF